MHLTVISSLDALCRQQACEAVAATHPLATLVLHDLLENGLVIRRIYSQGTLVEHSETLLEHGCLSCTVRLDVVPTVAALLDRGDTMVIIGLPPAVSSESGFTPVREDQRTPGEFLMGELCFSDTILLAEPALLPVDPALRRRGVQLIAELAPHADVVVDPAAIRPGRHDYQEALGRSVPGSVRIPAAVSASPFTTVTHRAERPLHPERFRDALTSLAAGCCWLRGRLWIAAAPRCRIAIQGIGPRVWLENTGPWLADQDTAARPDPLDYVDASLDWHPEHGDRCSVIAATGDGIDAAEIAGLLAGCELTDEEMASGFAGLADPFQLESAPQLTPHSK
jgi:G3E family GTPase